MRGEHLLTHCEQGTRAGGRRKGKEEGSGFAATRPMFENVLAWQDCGNSDEER